MKKFWIGFLAGLLLPVVLLLAGLLVAGSLAGRRVKVPADATLVLELSGEFPEAPRLEWPALAWRGAGGITMREAWRLFDEASRDKKIRAVLVKLGGLDVGWGKLQELAAGLSKLRAAGKPVVAYLESPGARQYYLATSASRIYMSPESWLDLKGLRAELIYLAEGLNKLGVRVEIERAGRYKDAGDMFTRSDMSPETREVVESLLDTLYADLVQRIAQGRRLPPDKARAILDNGPFLASQAVREGLIDGLRYWDQVEEELKQELKQTELRKISGEDYLRAIKPPKGRRHSVAFLVAEGTILRGSDAGLGEDGLLFSHNFEGWIRQISEDKEIEGVILRIDSPGGDALASDEMLWALRKLGQKKPIVVSMSDTAASGGYYIAMTGGPVLAYPGTVTGSIGVLYGKVTLRELYDKLGIRKVILKRGQFADIDSDYEPLTTTARQKLREGVQATYETFLRRVAEGRKRDLSQIRSLAEGRVWLGSQAATHGLVDALGGLDEAVQKIRELLKIPKHEPVLLIPYPSRKTLWEVLLSRSRSALHWFPGLEDLAYVRALTRGGILAIPPYQVRID